jgi:hypothetical protein
MKFVLLNNKAFISGVQVSHSPLTYGDFLPLVVEG